MNECLRAVLKWRIRGSVACVEGRFLGPLSTMFLLSHGSALGQGAGGNARHSKWTRYPTRLPGTQFSQRRENLPSLSGVYSHNNRLPCNWSGQSLLVWLCKRFQSSQSSWAARILKDMLNGLLQKVHLKDVWKVISEGGAPQLTYLTGSWKGTDEGGDKGTVLPLHTIFPNILV